MKIDEIIDQTEFLITENRVLREKNMDMLMQLYRLKATLDSALNLLDPEQIRIIQLDIRNYLMINQNA